LYAEAGAVALHCGAGVELGAVGIVAAQAEVAIFCSMRDADAVGGVAGGAPAFGVVRAQRAVAYNRSQMYPVYNVHLLSYRVGVAEGAAAADCPR
jgi:hypothetical protein